MGNALRGRRGIVFPASRRGKLGAVAPFLRRPLCFFFGPWLYSREFSMAGMGWMIDVAIGFMRRCSGFRSQLARRRRRRRRAVVGWFLRIEEWWKGRS